MVIDGTVSYLKRGFYWEEGGGGGGPEKLVIKVLNREKLVIKVLNRVWGIGLRSLKFLLP